MTAGLILGLRPANERPAKKPIWKQHGHPTTSNNRPVCSIYIEQMTYFIEKHPQLTHSGHRADWSVYEFSGGPFSLTLIPVWLSNFIDCKMWHGVAYPFPNFNGGNVEVYEWTRNFIPHFTLWALIYAGLQFIRAMGIHPCYGHLSMLVCNSSMLVKGVSCV